MRNLQISIFLIFLISFSGNLSFGQQSQLAVADTLFNRNAFYLAAEQYKKELNRNDTMVKCHCKRQLAVCYSKLNDIRNSEIAYRDLLNSCKTDLKDLKGFASILQRSGEVEKAKKIYETCYLSDTTDHFSYQSIQFCDIVKNSFDGLTETYLENLATVNSSFDDVLDDVINDTLNFISARKSKRNKDRSVSNNQFDYEHFTWHPSSKRPQLSHDWGDGFTAVVNDAHESYITKELPDSSLPGHKRAVILRRRNVDNGLAHENLFGFDDGRSNYGHPNLSVNGNLFFFISDMPGGYGGTDIYFCKKEGSKWSKPVNLGKEVNTYRNELFPFYLGQGLMVFTSEGRPGYGGFDLYASEFKNDKWKEAINLGFPVNSKSNDLALRWDRIKKTIYLSSDRAKGKGGIDIYKLQRFDSENIKRLF